MRVRGPCPDLEPPPEGGLSSAGLGGAVCAAPVPQRDPKTLRGRRGAAATSARCRRCGGRGEKFSEIIHLLGFSCPAEGLRGAGLGLA